MGHQSIAFHSVRCVCLDLVKGDDPDGAVKHVVVGPCGRNSVNGVAVGCQRVAVNRRVVGLHHTTEGAVNNTPARHYHPIRRPVTPTNDANSKTATNSGYI